ncbi:MAG TPA: tRNA (adenosine(37)-N6)-threonylcarbamoyltransferase complex dimerization subunit type 1 TsaB [Cyclobacteriaceae bacterium]|nr:tRNA (adenosine(37)-N6)-threonylcarbamoyltransferase complex dimerization subunit type 1 TsaB [Cyclobacteriaceae bacterium]
MGLILSIETSTTVCSAALHREGELLASEITEVPNSAASQLAVMIDKILSRAGVVARDLSAVAVSAGPGSYTGLRIGVATAKGVCYALGIPLIAVNSLELMAAQVTENNPGGAWLCPMIDARRMEVYTMLFDNGLGVIEPVRASVIDASSYAAVVEKREVLFFGNGSDKCRDVITHPNAKFVSGMFPSAEWLGRLALERLRAGKFEDVGEFEPFYLKDFIAKKPKSLV